MNEESPSLRFAKNWYEQRRKFITHPAAVKAIEDLVISIGEEQQKLISTLKWYEKIWARLKWNFWRWVRIRRLRKAFKAMTKGMPKIRGAY